MTNPTNLNKIIKSLKKMNDGFGADDLFKIQEYINENIPYELLQENDFYKELCNIGPNVEFALNSYFDEKAIEKVKKEIEEKGLENVIEDDTKLALVPREYRKELFDIANRYESDEEYEKSKRIYKRIVEYGTDGIDKFAQKYNRENDKKLSLYYKSIFFYYRSKIMNGETITKEDEENINKLLKEDKDNILGLIQKGKLSKMDFFKSFFEDIKIEEIDNLYIPILKNAELRKNGNTANQKTKDRPENLSPTQILSYIKDKFGKDNLTVKIGKGMTGGFVLIEIKDKDTLIAENFGDIDKRTGELLLPKNAATYFIHKNADIEMIVSKDKDNNKRKLTNLVDKNNKGLVLRTYHTGDYYSNFDKKFNQVEENGKNIKDLDTLIDTQLSEGTKFIIEEDELNKDTKMDYEMDTETEHDVDYEIESNMNTKKTPETEDFSTVELLELVDSLDSKYNDYLNKQVQLDLKVSSILEQIDNLTKQAKQNLDSYPTDYIKDKIIQGLQLIEEQQEQLDSLESDYKRIKSKEDTNRQIQSKLSDKFNKEIRGE